MVSRKLTVVLLASLVACAVIAVPVTAPPSPALAQPSASIRCEIEVEDFGTSVRLQGIVIAGDAVRGAYDMLVNGPAASVHGIRQQGEFAASANRPERLGIVELRKGSGGYNAVLRIVWKGAEYRCGRRIGDAWS